jgi:hypothetical protein
MWCFNIGMLKAKILMPSAAMAVTRQSCDMLTMPSRSGKGEPARAFEVHKKGKYHRET